MGRFVAAGIVAAVALGAILASSAREIRIVEGTDIEGGKGSPGKKKKQAPQGKAALLLSREPNYPDDPGWMLPLYGSCFTFIDEKKTYEYELCPFQNVTQVEIKRTKKAFVLGIWGKWVSDGAAQMYSDGDSCDDVNRSTTVSIECGAVDFLLHSLEEPSMCNYTINFQVPISCALLPNAAPVIYPETANEKGRGRGPLQHLRAIFAGRRKVSSQFDDECSLQERIAELEAEVKELTEQLDTYKRKLGSQVMNK